MNDVPESIGPFEVIRKLGTNGWIETFEAFGKSPPHSRYVVRRLIPAMRDWPEGVEMFRRKVGKLARLCHPNVFTVDFHDPDNFFYATGFLKGQSLDESLQYGPLALETSLSTARDLGAALAHTHERGILHGELSPACCFLTADGRGMLKNFNDFVAPRDVAMIPRNPVYLTPEAIKGQAIDARSDVYCLAALLWQMLCGRSAYRYETQLEVLKQKILEPPPSPRAENDAVPLYLDAVIRRAMATDPNLRFGTIRDFLEAIETVPKDFPHEETDSGYGLAILSGDDRGKIVPLTDTSFTVGRQTDNNLVLTDDRSERKQFRLLWLPEAGNWYLQVFGAGPTLLNGKICRPDQTGLTPVAEGDLISIGRTVFSVVCGQLSVATGQWSVVRD